MTVPFMRAYTELLVQTCHRRGAHAIGGMAAFIPNRRDPAVTETALAKVRDDKERESRDGFDGTWVAHPDLVPVALEVFDGVLGAAAEPEGPAARGGRRSCAADLLDLTVAGGRVTEAGVRANVRVALAYLDSWLRGVGAAAIDNLMEDAATAEISRSQLWLWITQPVPLDDGARSTPAATRRSVTRSSIVWAAPATGPPGRGRRPARPAGPGRRLRRVPDAACLRAARLMVPDWAEFYRAMIGREPRALLPRALEAWGTRPPGVAMDLGAGDGTESFALLAAGWQVTAVDFSEASASLMRDRVDPATHRSSNSRRGRSRMRPFPTSTSSTPGTASHSSHRPPSRRRGVASARPSRPGGILAANLFGPRDTWAKDPKMNFHDRAAVEALLDGLEIVDLQEQDSDGDAVTGPKHWHVLEFVARQPG